MEIKAITLVYFKESSRRRKEKGMTMSLGLYMSVYYGAIGREKMSELASVLT